MEVSHTERPGASARFGTVKNIFMMQCCCIMAHVLHKFANLVNSVTRFFQCITDQKL